ncbi:hypothetical protein, partial [Neisseria meningitidis]|uniref:hypothetical protein n=1 Tax=Neisseria meningitidis TaxID=487 RepID=UPI001E501BA8
QKVGKIRKVLHFENEIEHKILVTYVIAKVSIHYKDRRASAAVIPAQAGIWNFNASRIYRKKPKPFRRHSHES